MADLIELKDSGVAVLTLNGKRVTLGRPTVGVLNDLDDLYTETVYGNQDALDAHQEKVRALAEEHGFDVEHAKADAAGRVIGYWQIASAGMDSAKERTKTLTGWLTEVAEEVDATSSEDPSRSTDWRRAKKGLEKDLKREVQKAWFEVGRWLIENTAAKAELPDDDRDLDPMLGSDVLYRRLIHHWSSVPLG